MCISKRQKSYIIIINIEATQTGFLILKQYHSLEHAET